MPNPRRTAALVLLAALAAAPAEAWAAETAGAERPERVLAQAGDRQTRAGQAAAGAQNQTTLVVDDQDAQRTREVFTELLRKYPPSLARVLKLDPTLLANQAYLAPYPALTSFLNQHPEVVRNSSYFLGSISIGDFSDNNFRQTAGERMWDRMSDGIGFLVIFGTFASLFAWLVKTLVDYRRWQKLAKVQTDAHTKLLDRFTANDELIAYVQSPAGSQFLQSAPINLDPGARRLGAPFGRILWSVQAGLVLAMGGLGLQYVSGRVDPDASQPIFALGVLALALGAGFVLSAIVAYYLSRRLGLFESPAKLPLTGHHDTPGA